jgi:predicted MFS family arabinose efflux permease
MLKNIHQDSILNAFFLSVFATAGLFYVNLGGSFLSAFVDGLNIQRDAAGFIVSANKYGAAFGGLLAAIFIKKLVWRKSAYILLLLLISIDIISSQISNANLLIFIRFLHGSIGGFLVGIGLSVIARTSFPDKVFGMLMVVQYSFGSVGIFTVPRLVDAFGYSSVFFVLITFSIMTLLILPIIPDPAEKKVAVNKSGTLSFRAKVLLTICLMSLFLFQASNMGVADFAFELGKDIDLTNKEISNLLTIANVISISGGVLAYLIATRFGRTLPLLIGFSIASLFTYLLNFSENITIYFIANSITGITWGFVIPYLLGLAATFDKYGQMAALAGFVSKIGLASGPLIASFLIIDFGFSVIINLAAFGLLLGCILAVYASKQSSIADNE